MLFGKPLAVLLSENPGGKCILIGEVFLFLFFPGS